MAIALAWTLEDAGQVEAVLARWELACGECQVMARWVLAEPAACSMVEAEVVPVCLVTELAWC